MIDVFPIIGLAIFAMRAFKETGAANFFGWLLTTFFLYGIVKAIVVSILMLAWGDFVFPVPEDLHLPGMIVAVLVVGAIYYRCWVVKRREGDSKCQ